MISQQQRVFWKTFIVLCIALGFCRNSAVAGVDIYVPDSFATIQDAIDAASNGDRIIVRDGGYSENVDFKGKAITVKSENGPQSCAVISQEFKPVFSFTNNEGLDSVLEGFTITGGFAPMGAGIYCSLSSPTIKNCIVSENNSFASEEGVVAEGGGIYLNQSGAVIEDCLIKENVANGAGHGGGIYMADSSATIRNCKITGNLSLSTPGMAGSGQGGGIYSVSYTASVYPTIEDSLIADNLALGDDIDDPGRGGGIYCRHSSPTISRSTIIGNFVTGAPGSGGRGGGIACREGASPVLVNSVIAGNVAVGLLESIYTPGQGGGLYCRENSSPTIINCTVADNANSFETDAAGPDAAGLFLRDNSLPVLTNVILWGNIPAAAQISTDGTQPNVSFSDVQGGYAGTSNLDLNPQFIGGGDYHLTADSPCIDAGTSTGAPNVDIDGESRPQMAGYDIGADEFTQIFGDVPPGYWADKYIRALFYAGITKGCGVDTNYCPDEQVTRAQMAAFLVRAAELIDENYDPAYSMDPYFSDVGTAYWAFGYIQKLKEFGLTTGYSDGSYGPEDLVTRAQMATFLVRAAELVNENYDPAYSMDPYFSDVGTDYWAFGSIQKLKELGVTTGYSDGSYGPEDLVTRAQMSAFLARAFLLIQ